MNGLMRKSLLLRSMVVLAVSTFASFASAQIHGAIYTSLGDGTVVNQNQYAAKEDVYLNGGPQGGSSNGLPDGLYYFMVTDPSGSVKLSSDNILNRMLQVVGGRVFGHVDNPGFPGHVDGTFNATNGSIPVQLFPFADTPNTGGVYKVWLIPIGDYEDTQAGNAAENFGFKSGNTKTDNFKVIEPGDPPPPVQSLIKGSKFYDLNHDGERNPGEPGIAGWEINIVGTLGGDALDINIFTDINGNYTQLVDQGTEATVCEVMPIATPAWVQSYPNEYDQNPGGEATADGNRCWHISTVPAYDVIALDFGNYRAVTFSGHKFYDANADGLDNDGQVVQGIRINVVDDGVLYDPLGQGYTTTTDASGNWSIYINLFDTNNHTYMIREIVPGTGDASCTWVQSAPISGSYTVSTSATGLNFGNYCRCLATGGRTLGFWSNKNGQAILAANHPVWRTLLNGLNLRTANGTNYDIPLTAFNNAYGSFRTWLLNATATNMAYMLSAQLAANVLDTQSFAFGLSGSDVVLLTPALAACYGSNSVQISVLQSQANALLGADGYTPAGDTNRAHQECLKNILDAINNNLLPIIDSTPCDVVYP
jgi:hypothetical protein